jgi:hypothetical protein
MAKPFQIQIIEQARCLIADKQHWCRGQLAEDADGISVYPTSASVAKRCALGAVIAAAYQLTHDYDTANELAHNALRPHAGISTLVHVNDVRGHAAVLALFDQVIAADIKQ